MKNKMVSEQPKKVRIATNLLYSVIAIGIVRAVINIIRHADVRSIGLIHVGHAFWFVALTYLVYMISQRRNWARITLLVILIINIPLAMLPIFDSITHSLLPNTLGFVQMLLSITALTLLYFRESRDWFHHDK